MLTFDQIKAIETALGPDKAPPIIHAFESVEERLRDNLVTKAYFDAKAAEAKSYLDIKLAELRGDFEARHTEIKGEMDVKLATLRGDLEVRLAETKGDIIKWVAGMLVAQAALIAALVKLL